MNLSRTSRTVPYVALFAVWLLWGSTFLGIRVGVETIPPLLMAGIRFTLAGLALALPRCLTRSAGISMPTRAQWLRIVVAGFLLLLLGNGLLCLGEQRVPSGAAALIVASTPVWMIVFDAILSRAPMSVWSIVGLVIGTAGTALLVGLPSGGLNPWFALVIILGSISWAVGSILARRSPEREHPMHASLEMVVGGIMLLVVAFFTGEFRGFAIASVSAVSWYGLLWLITGGAMLGYSAYGVAVRALPTPIVATYAYVNPIVAVILGAVFLHERMTPGVIVGGVAIVAAVVVIGLGQRAQQQLRKSDALVTEAA